MELGLVLPGIWHLPILEGDSNIVKEPVVGPGQRPERKANDANVVEEEEGVVFVRHVSCVRSRPATPIIQGVKAVDISNACGPLKPGDSVFAMKFRAREGQM